MKFHLHCIPPKSTHQSSLRVFKIGNHYSIGKSKKGQDTQNGLMALLLPYVPEQPLTGALKLNIRWVYPYRKSEPKKNRTGLIPCTTKPDIDNLSKFLCDCLTRLGFWTDDSLVYSLSFEKYWGDDIGIFIEITN